MSGIGDTAFTATPCSAFQIYKPNSTGQRKMNFQNVSGESLYGRNRSVGRESNVQMMSGYATLCCLSGMIAVMSILLLHSLTSIWLDPLRNMRLHEEFVYVTVAMATSSAALNLSALSIYSIQIFLVCTDRMHNDTRKLQYLRGVAGVRYVATISVFISIPVFTTSFGCYLYMELHWLAGIIAVSILGLAVIFIICAVSVSFCKWDRMRHTVTRYQPNSYIEANGNTDCWIHAPHAQVDNTTRLRRTNEALRNFCTKEGSRATTNAAPKISDAQSVVNDVELIPPNHKSRGRKWRKTTTEEAKDQSTIANKSESDASTLV